MIDKTIEKENNSIMKEDEETVAEGHQTSASSSNCSSPRSGANSATVSLDTELSKVCLSGSSINSQLEALANTNLLTVRIKLDDQNEGSSDEMQVIISKIEGACHQHKGTFVNAAHIEPYEYLPDSERLKVLEKNKDVYIFESGNAEFASFASNDLEESDWKYDRVLQVQFKRFNTLKTVCNVVQNILKDRGQVVERWSISINDHALAQPANLYIKGVPKNMLMDEILPTFSKFGPVSSLKIICDNVTGESLGYGFISYPLGSQASRCISELNGKMLGSSSLFINYHIERKERERIYRDNIKENSDDEKFKGIFVGNLPLFNSSDQILTPEDVIEFFREGLSSSFPDLGIESAYFPRKNKRGSSQSLSEGETEEENEISKAQSTVKEESEVTGTSKSCCPQYGDNPFKNYGFIKFANHAQALKAIELFNDFEWLGSRLVVNKAVQNKSQACYHKKSLASAGFGNRGDNQYYASPNLYGFYGGNMFFPYLSSRGSLSASTSGETDPSESEAVFPISRPVSAGPYGPPYHTFEPISNPQQGPHIAPFDPSASNSMFPMNTYGLMPQNSPFVLPLPTRDQQESNLYVKHIPLSWKDEDLFEFYQTFGEIISAKIITVGGGRSKDAESQTSGTPALENDDTKNLGNSRGYGFVCFKNPLDASRAILATDDFPLSDTHTLHVSFAQKRAKFNQNSTESRGNFQRTSSDSHSSSSRSISRRASFNDHSRGQYNIKFLNAMRQQRAPSGGNMPNNFLPNNGPWPGLPLIPPSVPPTLSSVSYVPPTSNPTMMMMGSYVLHQPTSMKEDDGCYESAS